MDQVQRNQEDGERRVRAVEDFLKPEGNQATVNEKFFIDGKDVDLRTDLSEELTVAIADAEFLAAFWDCSELAFYIEQIMRKRVSLRRLSRSEWVNVNRKAEHDELRAKQTQRPL